jgi:hypothetical protein
LRANFCGHRTCEQRQYEALRAYFVEQRPSAEVARAFGYSPGSIASGLYRLLARQMRGYADAQARRLYRDLVDMPASVRIAGDAVHVHFHRRAHLPIIVASGLLDAPVPIPWWGNLPLRMSTTTWFVILPLGLASLMTGLVQALGTAWGLFRHYWIFFKLLLSAIATFVLLLKIEPISYLANVAAGSMFSSGDLIGLRTSLLVHAIGGLVVLLAATALAVYKPVGMTRYGARKQREQAA